MGEPARAPEQRCDHGFLRSVAPCPICDLPKVVRARIQQNERTRASYREFKKRTRKPPEVVQRTGTYVCRKCGVEKALTEFYVSRTTPQGHQSRCKACDNDRSKGRKDGR